MPNRLTERTNPARRSGAWTIASWLQSAVVRRHLLCALLLAVFQTRPAVAVDDAIDSVMFVDPVVPSATVVKDFPERLKALWLAALDRPEIDMKRQAAAAIALAHQRGMAGLESTIAPLVRTLDHPNQHPIVRLTIAKTLVALDARSAAASLLEHAQRDGIDMRNVVEPALARWKFAPARGPWLERLNQSKPEGRAYLLAIEGLAACGDAKAVPKLRDLMLNASTDPILRLEAAKALGTIQPRGREKEASQLAGEKAIPGSVSRLAAAWLLRRHHGQDAVKILDGLAVGTDAAAAVVALDALLEEDPCRITNNLAKVAASSDAAVRARGVEGLVKCPRVDGIAVVSELLDDPHPQVRVDARKALAGLGRKTEFAEEVKTQAVKMLATARWRGLEQAAILLGLLDFKPAAPRLTELLRFEKPEVFVAAAWGLRKLALPDTLPAQLREIERRWSQRPRDIELPPWISAQVAQLAQSMGQARYAPAAPILARYVRKQGGLGPGRESRAAAIWALGMIHQKAPPAGLISQLIERLGDEGTGLEEPEDPLVRRMSAIALGRMKATAAVDTLKRFYPGTLTREPISNACGWALEQITGEKLPTSVTVKVVQKGWFLEPNQ